jgi:hypothetical protein
MINVDELVAIDVRTLAEVSASGGTSLSGELDEAAKNGMTPDRHPGRQGPPRDTHGGSE